MLKERMMILEMLESGKLTPADAETLLRALGDTDDSSAANAPGEPVVWDVEQASHAERQAEQDERQAERAERQSKPAEYLGETGQPRLLIPGRDVPPPAPAAPAHPAAAPRPAPAARPVVAAHTRRRRYPDPSYAVAMKRAGLTFTPEQLFRLQDEGIEPEQVAGLMSVRRREWSVDDLVEMLANEVTPELVLKLHDLGLGDLSAREIVRLAEQDVQPEYLDRLQALDLPGLTVHDLIEFAIHEVDPDTARALLETGPVPPGDIIRAADHDVSASYARRGAQLLPGVTVRQLIELNDRDVSPRFIEELVEAGFTNLTVRQIIQMSDQDIDPGDAAWFREMLGESLTLEDLVRFANHDVTREYAGSLFVYNLPGLDKDTLVEMANHDMSAADIELAREAYGDDITAADLLEMAKNR